MEWTPPKEDEDHNVEKGFNSLSHNNLVHRFVPLPQAMKILDAEAAVDNEWQKLEKLSAWQLTTVKNKRKHTKTKRKSTLIR